MSMMSLNSINRKINETEQMIAEFENFGESEFASIQTEELKRRLDCLTEERENILGAQARELILFRLYGETVEAGRISNRMLVSMLDGFQSMVDNIANVIVGTNASRGEMKDYAKKISDFEVCGVFAGSFGVKLEKNYEQLEVTHESYKTSSILQEFFSIIENSSDGEKLIERISPYGQRTVKQYRDWLNHIKKNAVNVEIDWTNEIHEKRRMNMVYAKAPEIIFTLDSINNINDEDIYIRGLLTGVNIRTNTFELNAEEEGIIKGKSRIETLIKGSEKIGQEISVKLTKSTSESSVCGKKETWFLSDIL